MALPGSGQISMSQVSVELGRASNAQTSLGESAVRSLAGVASGPISFANLHGKSASAPVNPLGTMAASHNVSSPGTASAGLSFLQNGAVSPNTGNGYSGTSQWYSPTGGTPGNGYWIRCTVNSGTTPSGSATGTWLQLNTTRAWSLVRSGIGSVQCNCTIQIASDSGGSNIVASGTMTLFAQVESGA